MADNSTPYLEDVPGVKDVRLRGGALLPRRNVIEIDGARVVDDAVGGQTRIELRAPFIERPVHFDDFNGAQIDDFVCDNSDADAYRFVGFTGVIGLGAPRAGGRNRAWVFNADPTNDLDLKNQDTGAPASSRIVTGTGSAYTLVANGGMAILLYYGARWRVIG
jgi:hypothetical protein